MGASLAISTYVLSTNFMSAEPIVGQVQSVGLILLPFAFEVLAFLLLYLVMPNVKVQFTHALCGALFAASLFEGTKRLFGLYVLNFDSYQVVYGALSTLPIFLVWIYLSWGVALVGAELVAVIQNRKLRSESNAARY
jgi:membrane protein